VPSDRPWLAHYPEGVPASLTYRSIPIYQLLAESAARHPDYPAVRFYQNRLTYGQLWDQVQRCAAAFASLGIRPGDRIALMLPNCPQYVIAYCGALLAGAIVVQVNPLYTPRELRHLLANSGAETIVVADALYPVVQSASEGTSLKRALVTRLRGEVALGPEAQPFESLVAAAPALSPAIAVDPQDVAVLQYTGGTTGVSKGAMLTHFNIVANVAQAAAFNPETPPPGESRFLTVIPLFHVYGMTICLNLCLALGGELILLPRFDLAEVMATIKATQPTHFPGVPTMYVAVNGYPDAESYGLGSIKYLNSGAAPMPVEVMSAYEARFGGKILEGYGLSEASPFTHGHPPRAVRKPGTVGMPAVDTDCEIVDLDLGTTVLPAGDVGEIRIRGPQIMRGYWEMPEETAIALRDGWLYTGDIGSMDSDGYFSIVDRKKDMIIASGYNVYPRDVEEVLYEHPAIRECCVAGIPDGYRGETVKAYVVLRPGAELDLDEMREFCKERLAAYKVPKVVEVRDALPKSLVGKILRRVLVDADKAKLATSTEG
jgi:long-chain acyl-CoA synthetase